MLRLFIFVLFLPLHPLAQSWVRINQLGYIPPASKTAVWCGKDAEKPMVFRVCDSATGKTIFSGRLQHFGAYGPFTQTARLDFSALRKEGVYYILAGNARSPYFPINNHVYAGMADFCLRYMRQQRSGFNPSLNDSCHQYDGYTVYGPMPDGTHIPVAGGWHDASDYLQYSATSANAAWHLLAAWRDFPHAFGDAFLANGLGGKNTIPDVLDEARWGLDWLLKMHPQPDWLFNQLGDDRDHISMRMPGLDSQYGKGYERPVYFVNGQPQGLGKYKNRTTGTSSTAAKFSSAFALGAQVFLNEDRDYAGNLFSKALTAWQYAQQQPGVTQTAPNRAPYFYEEENWTDDMELAAISLRNTANGRKGQPENGTFLQEAYRYALQEPVTPWLGKDTAKHYQWYPFTSNGHFELAGTLAKIDKARFPELKSEQQTITGFLKAGIDSVWNRACRNAFYNGIPFIWCSNNLQTSFTIQCYRYRQITGDAQYTALEQAGFDWLLGCNPWGTSMVYGLPANGDAPADPHSAFTHLKKIPIDGGLVDGPVYGSIFKKLIGLTLYEPDEYAAFQSDLAVYHDDYGDYSTNEPTMDGTAAFIYLSAAMESENQPEREQGAIVRGPRAEKQIALVFTAHEFGEGGSFINTTLQQEKIKASFFLTGQFYQNPAFAKLVQQLKQNGHYLGPHSNDHLLYCDWQFRDSLLVGPQEFYSDLQKNERAMAERGIREKKRFFMPPYEWYNAAIAQWAKQAGWQLVNFSPGTRSTADYTWPELKNYVGSEAIYRSIVEKEQKDGLNGFILLVHAGTDARRTDKFYRRLPQLIRYLKQKGYAFVRIDELLK